MEVYNYVNEIPFLKVKNNCVKDEKPTDPTFTSVSFPVKPWQQNQV